MLFNSIEFALFLPIVFFLYWFVFDRRIRAQNLFLCVVSYIFYGWWDWRFLFLIAFSSLVDYLVGVSLISEKRIKRRKLLLMISIMVNLGFLGIFKYYNFFADTLVDAFTLFGRKPDIFTLNVILPVGISFYTFQTMSYSIDVYRRKLTATKDIVAFFAFVSFFPQLVAGPIERAAHLLPQFYDKREFSSVKSIDGCRQILWGLFKKVVIADNCALIVNQIFNDYQNHSAGALVLGAFFFAFQIYGDFSGYSDIAIGTARLFGFDLMRNFAFPYFSRDIAEFWRRWHISLSTWFRDYVYIPLGGSRGSSSQRLRNIMVIFLVSGLWHGANWTFIVWGLLHALLFLPILLLGRNRRHTDGVAEGRLLPSPSEMLQMTVTFLLVDIAWVFFRSGSVPDAIGYLRGMASVSQWFAPLTIDVIQSNVVISLVVLMLLVEWLQRGRQHALELDEIAVKRPLRWMIYYGIILIINIFSGRQQTFIYFQF